MADTRTQLRNENRALRAQERAYQRVIARLERENRRLADKIRRAVQQLLMR